MLVQARYSGVDENNRGVQAGASPKRQGTLKPMRPEGAGSIICGRAGLITQGETGLKLLRRPATKFPADRPPSKIQASRFHPDNVLREPLPPHLVCRR